MSSGFCDVSFGKPKRTRSFMRFTCRWK